MGTLKDTIIQTEVVRYAGGDFSVGALTASDLLALFLRHKQGTEALYAGYRKDGDPNGVFIDLVSAFPDIAAEIIARATGDYDDATLSKARRLDIGAQLTALEVIGTLTVASVGGLGNLAALIERLVRSAATAMAHRHSLQANGSTISESSAPSS